MAAQIPASHADLFDKAAIAHLATLMPGGQPQARAPLATVPTGSSTRGGVEHINALAKKYLGLDEYPNHNATDVRVIYLIEPDSFSKMG